MPRCFHVSAKQLRLITRLICPTSTSSVVKWTTKQSRHNIKMNHVVDMVRGATGWDTSLFELMSTGERTTNLARMFNIREGFDRKDDVLPARLFEPLETGPLTGEKIDKDKFENALKLYYEMMGWDPATGIPKEAKLYELNIADLSQF